MKITKRQLRRIIKEEKARLLNEYTPRDTSGMMPYASPEDMEEEIAMLQQTRDTIKAVSLPAPMDDRIMEAVEHLDKAIKVLHGDWSWKLPRAS